MRLPTPLNLLAGTVAILAVCYAIAAPTKRRSGETFRLHPPAPAANSPDIARLCETAVERFRSQSPADWAFRVHSPFVLTGDVPDESLDDLYRETIAPTSRALEIDYFDHPPAEPIFIVALATDDSYRQALERGGLSRRAEYSGLYQRDRRTIWLNLSTGAGTLAHELTHALAHADFPDLPEWFDEGLASLHEESEFSPDGQHLLGHDNWRLEFLKEADARGCWKPISQLLEEPFAPADTAGLDYALARNFCLFLQERGLLAPFYRKCRIGSDRAALLSLFPGQTLDDIDEQFRGWVRGRTK